MTTFSKALQTGPSNPGTEIEAPKYLCPKDIFVLIYVVRKLLCCLALQKITDDHFGRKKCKAGAAKDKGPFGFRLRQVRGCSRQGEFWRLWFDIFIDISTKYCKNIINVIQSITIQKKTAQNYPFLLY